MSVFMMEPNEEGNRQIYTLSKTIIPTYQPEQYLDSLMCDMLNRKKALHDNFYKERPWMNQRRGPVGFAVTTPATEDKNEDNQAAANYKSEVK